MLNKRTICYNFRNLQEFQSERKKTVFYGFETIIYRTPQLWTILPEDFKQRNTISLFKSDIRNWICNESLQIVQSIRTKPRVYLRHSLTWYLIFNMVYFNACIYMCISSCREIHLKLGI